MNWMNLKRWVQGWANVAGRGPDRRAPEVRDPAGSVEQAAYHQPRNRRAERIRSWRRSALSKKGAKLYSAMQANSETGSLAMLDEGGMVISWHERTDGAAANDRVVDTHMSQFYLAADLALGVPVRDLCSAAIHGHSTQAGWRRFPEGATCWATTVIEPIWLRDGRLQGFSHVTRRSADTHQNVRAMHDKLPLPRWKISAERVLLARR